MKGLYCHIRGPAIGKPVAVLLLASFSPQFIRSVRAEAMAKREGGVVTPRSSCRER